MLPRCRAHRAWAKFGMLTASGTERTSYLVEQRRTSYSIRVAPLLRALRQLASYAGVNLALASSVSLECPVIVALSALKGFPTYIRRLLTSGFERICFRSRVATRHNTYPQQNVTTPSGG